MKTNLVCLTIALLLFSIQTNAQWQLTGNFITRSVVQNNSLVVASSSAGVYVSYNLGATWTFNSSSAFNYEIRNLVVKDSTLFATVPYNGIYKSSDNGISWTSCDAGIAIPENVYSLILSDTALLVGTSGSFVGDTASIYQSLNNGISWDKVYYLSNIDAFITFVTQGSEVWVSNLPSGVFYSNNNGGNWTLKNGAMNAKQLGLTNNGNLVCGPGPNLSSINLSTDYGATWTLVKDTIVPYDFTKSGNYTFAGTSKGFYYSTDDGYTWIEDNAGLPLNTGIISVAVVDSVLILGTDSAQVYRKNISEITPVSNNELNEMVHCIIYPNPSNNALNIQLNSPQVFQFTLYNSLGEKIIDRTLKNRSSTIDISAYSSDIYFYKLTSADNHLVKCGKLIKQ